METVFLFDLAGGLVLGVVIAIIISHLRSGRSKLETMEIATYGWVLAAGLGYLISVLQSTTFPPLMFIVGAITCLLILALYR